MVPWCLGTWSAPHPRRGACTPAPRAADHPIRAMPRGPAAETIGRMSDPTFQTVRLRRGAHASPEHGACVVELASMLAEERFSDHPRSVCRVIAGFLRVYNDRLPPSELDEIRPLAAMVVGSAASWSVRRRRRRRLVAWMQAEDPRRRIGRFPAPEEVVVAAARTAAALDERRRTIAVADLVAELVATGTTAATDHAAPPPPHVPAETATAAAVHVTTIG